jgi:hypothetical protein
MIVPYASREADMTAGGGGGDFAGILLMSLILAKFIITWTEGTSASNHGRVLRNSAKLFQQMWLAFIPTIISANFAALTGIIMRSILGGTLMGVFFTYIEGLSVLGVALLAHLFDYPKLVHLYRLTPSYNIANVGSWINGNHPTTEDESLTFLGDLLNFADDMSFSVTILMIWWIGQLTAASSTGRT